MTRICPRCQNADCLIVEADGVFCILCGHRPEDADPGKSPQFERTPYHVSGHGYAMRAISVYEGRGR